MTPAPWSVTDVTAVPAVTVAQLEVERAAHDATRRELASARNRIRVLRDLAAANRDGTPSVWEELARRQALMLDALQRSQAARDVEMAEHLNRHVCTPKAQTAPVAAAQKAAPPGVRW